MGCFTVFLVIGGSIFVMLSLIRWFEQTAEAVEQRWWNKLLVLLVMPFSVWFFPSRVAAGRPVPVPHHEPVRGFGSVKAKPAPDSPPTRSRTDSAPRATATSPDEEGPPPGTPPQFLGKPIVPSKPRPAKPAIDPDKIEKLKQKLREQGMLGDD